MASNTFSCFILGEGDFPIQCAEVLLDRGHTIYGMISSDLLVKDWAQERNIPYIDPKDTNIVTFFGQHPFDYLFSIVNEAILPQEILGLPRRCAINYHDSLLPRYAGSYVTSWAILQGEKVHGVTWHVMAERVDAGDILKQCSFEIDDDETAFTLNVKCYDAAVSSFAELIDDISGDHVSARKQDLNERTFFSHHKKPSPGCTLSWNRSARDIGAFVRALDFGPYPNPMGLPKLAVGTDFIIVSEIEVLDSRPAVPPGTVTHIDPGFIRVSTLDGEIALRKLLTIDGQPLPVPDFVTKFGLYEGYQFKELDQEVANRITAFSASIGQHEEFWTKQLGTLEKITLPYMHGKTPYIQTARYLDIPPSVPGEIVSHLENLFATCRIGDILLAAFAAYLARIAEVWSFDIGYRDAELESEIADLEGLFAAYVPLHVIMEYKQSFEEAFHAVQEQTKLAKQRKTYARDIMARYPVLRSKANLQEAYLPSIFIERVEALHDYKAPHGSELTLVIGEDGVECLWIYNAEVLDEESVVAMQQGFMTFLQGIASDPQRPISTLPLLTKDEQHRLLVEWTATETAYPKHRCIHELFEEQVERTPEAVAVICGQEQLTYRNLNQRANQLAHCLQDLGVGTETVVSLLAERGIGFLVSMLAAFKAGGAYLPLDPHYPPMRLRHILEHSSSHLVIAAKAFAPVLSQALEGIPTETWPHVVYLEDFQNRYEHADGNLPVRTTSRNLAYVIYTSGSTGVPKGVMIEQRGMVNHIYAKIADLHLTASDCIAQTASQCFDISVWQFLAALVVGGRVHIYPDAIAHDPVQLLKQVDQHEVSIVETVPSLLRATLEAYEGSRVNRPTLKKLRWLIPTGEALTADLCRRWLNLYSQVPLLNAYGPTECSDDVSHHPIYQPPAEGENNIPIGRAVANMRLYVLDSRLMPVPIGVSGELYVGGVGVGRGYLNDAFHTAQAFVSDPFGTEPEAWLYKTGDLARYRADGTLEFLGRIDHQVKIRGFRIELGEIEMLLHQHSAIRDVVVIAREDIPGDQRLVAYIVLHEGLSVTASDLQSYVTKHLPAYMVPSAFVLLDKLPLTPNGKVDRRALPVPDMLPRMQTDEYVSPRTPAEEILASIWSQVLGIERVGIHNNFFDLGGHSLLATQISARLCQTFQVELPLQSFFQAPTVAQMAGVVTQMQAAGAGARMPALRARSREAYRVSSTLPMQGHAGPHN
jgi:amino acid adenylation domain-containing protein